MSNKNVNASNSVEILLYTDELIETADPKNIEIAKKFLNFSFDKKYMNYKYYLVALTNIKEKIPNYEVALENLLKISYPNNLIIILIVNCQFYLEKFNEIIKFHETNKEIANLKFQISNPAENSNSNQGYSNKTSNNNDVNQHVFESAKLQNNEEYLLLVAMSYEKLNINKEALRLYLKIIEINSDNRVALNNFLSLCIKSGNQEYITDEIIEICIKNKEDVSPEILNNIAVFYFKNGKIEESLNIYENILLGEKEFNISLELKCSVLNNYIYFLTKSKRDDLTVKAEQILEDNYLDDLSGIQCVIYGKLKMEKLKNLKEKSYSDFSKVLIIYEKYISSYKLKANISDNDDLNVKNYQLILKNYSSLKNYISTIKPSESDLISLNNTSSKHDNSKKSRRSNNNIYQIKVNDELNKTDNISNKKSQEFVEENLTNYKNLNNQSIEINMKSNSKSENKIPTFKNDRLNHDEIKKQTSTSSKENRINNFTNVDVDTVLFDNKSYKNDQNNSQTHNINNSYISDNKSNIIIKDDSENSVFNDILCVFENEKNTENSNFALTKEKIKELKSLSEDQMIQINTIISFIALFENNYELIIEKLLPIQDKLNSNQFYMLEKALQNNKDYEVLINLYIERIKENKEYIDKSIQICQILYENNMAYSDLFTKIVNEVFYSFDEMEKIEILTIITDNVFSNNISVDFLSKIYKLLITHYNNNYRSSNEKDKIIISLLNARYHTCCKNYNLAFEIFVKYEEELNKKDNIEYLRLYAKSCFKIKNYKKANKIYKNCLKLDNQDFNSCMGVGESYLNLDNLEGASKYFNYCLEMNYSESNTKVYSHLLFLLGKLMLKSKNSIEAMNYFVKCIDKDPNHYLAYYNMSEIYSSKNDFNEAMDCLKKALEIKPQFYVASYDLNCLYLKKLAVNSNSEYDATELENLKNEFLNIIDYLPKMYLDFATLLIKEFKDAGKAVIYSRKYIKLKEMDSSKVFSFIEFMIFKDYCSESKEVIGEFMKKFHHHSAEIRDKDLIHILKISDLYCLKQKNDLALFVVKDCSIDYQNDFNVISRLGMLQAKIGELESAMNNLKLSEDLYDVNVKYNGFLKYLGLCYCIKGEYEKGRLEMVKHHSKSTEKNNNLILAAICQKLGKSKECENYLNIERKLFSTNSTIEITDLEKIDFKDYLNK